MHTSPADARSLRQLRAAVNRLTRPGQPIFVANPRFDRVRVGDPLLYIILGHPNPTRYDVMQPGLVTTARVQREIIASLRRSHTRLVVRWLESDGIGARERRRRALERRPRPRPLPGGCVPALGALRRLPGPGGEGQPYHPQTMSEEATAPVVAPPPGHPRFPLVDSLRAIAALSVLVYHTGYATSAIRQPVYGAFIERLNVGVTLFFVISGFLLYRPFVAARLLGAPSSRLRDYARRRLLRIVPAYWLALTVLAIYPGLSGVFTNHWWIYYGFLQIYNDGTVLQGIGPAWTLCIEITSTRRCRSTPRSSPTRSGGAAAARRCASSSACWQPSRRR